MINTGKNIKYVDPPSYDYYENRLFDKDNLVLNRDDTLAPFIRLQDALSINGIDLQTADYMMQHEVMDGYDYYSLGIIDNYMKLKSHTGVNLRAFVIFEPPVVDPRLYESLPDLSEAFDQVYIHNTIGDGYSLEGVNVKKLRKLYWPQPHKDVLFPFWSRKDRMRRLVMINGSHKPKSFKGELYSRRIEVLVALARFGKVDLYGRGWDRWWMRNSMWLPYWRHRSLLMSIYKGSCRSKYEILSRYEFAICFENMTMKGYVTEKIFDCLYAGTVPLYLGAPDISELIPEDAYIDCRDFISWEEMLDFLLEMSPQEILRKKEAGRNFLQSARGMNFYNSLLGIFGLPQN